jgi:predicted metal-dependent hydrolase
MLASLLRQTILPFDRVEPAPPAPTLPVTPQAEVSNPEPSSATIRALPPVVTAQPPASEPPVAITYVRHPRARRYLLRVRVDGSVRATIPRGGSKREAIRFIESQTAWIGEQLRAAARVRATRRPPIPAAEMRALKRRAAEELPPRLHELAARFDVTVKKVSIRNQRWRWGSCSRQAHICLNWRLIQMPDWVRDYVLIHELMHLRRLDHSPAFWRHVADACPDYQKARAWLREHGHGLTED